MTHHLLIFIALGTDRVAYHNVMQEKRPSGALSNETQ
jgi:hypothetical protein